LVKTGSNDRKAANGKVPAPEQWASVAEPRVFPTGVFPEEMYILPHGPRRGPNRD